jgi:hypothetical protein
LRGESWSGALSDSGFDAVESRRTSFDRGGALGYYPPTDEPLGGLDRQ